MTIRNPNAYRDGAWDWGFLDGCFAPTRVRVSDIDGIVERRGRFLVIETKPRNELMTKGQQLLLDAFARMENFTVLVIYGEANAPQAMRHWPRPEQPATAGHVQAFVRDWWGWANGLREAA
jgi:hypothetical protein